jgi:DNA-nicking Smr family endonuclease
LRALSDPSDTDDPQATEIPIDGTLDLHTFHPRELRELVPADLEACAERGIFEVRVVHGKGTGTLRHAVEASSSRNLGQ